MTEISHKNLDSEKNFREFIGTEPKVLTFLHNTNDEEIAKKILIEGFEFENYLDHTTDLISGNDAIELRYFKIKRGRYGNYTIVIQISRKLIDHYCLRLKNTHNHYSEVLTKIPPKKLIDRELIYTLPENFIKGYFNQETKTGIFNHKFDPFKDIPVFEENVEKLLGKINNP
ncbi:MAG: hypothetical protein KAT68_06420 [Bacteroidales bacterium]|nr:hypothetical protein [Bacteroidales bacterium]